MFESFLQQGMVGGEMLSHGFNPNLFVTIVVIGMFGMIVLFLFSMNKKQSYGFWRK